MFFPHAGAAPHKRLAAQGQEGTLSIDTKSRPEETIDIPLTSPSGLEPSSGPSPGPDHAGFHFTPHAIISVSTCMFKLSVDSPPSCSGVTADRVPLGEKEKGNDQHTESCRLCRYPSNSADVFCIAIMYRVCGILLDAC